MRGYNPLNIPFEKVDEKEGTLEFRITKGNLMNTSLENVLFFDIQVRDSRFALHRDKNVDLVFTHWNTKMGIRVAKINIREFSADGGLFIALTWSGKESYLYAGEEGGLNLKSSKAEQKGGEIRMGKNGALYQIGEEGIEVGWYRVREAGRDVLEPSAKEIWDFTVTKVNILIEGCKLKDFLFESTLVQQCSTMLVTGFEVYTRTRFVEMEKEGKKPNIEGLMKEFARKKFVKDEIENYAKSMGKSLLESMLEVRKGKGVINFQNWKDCKAAYNKAYGIKFGEIPNLTGGILENIQNYIALRHKIIYSKYDMTVLNFDKVPPEEPIFANKEFIEQVRDDFIEFMEKLHRETEAVG
ncbi:MAG: hypothetical protein GIS02_03585 [Methanosarcinales archaeon]|uniref:Uncharacterized protein n=1 Tax=Candidatus Ethanoperedens thermophilum TaxID=2766897 RepID=A0A848D9S8_9EURY|nr:hypothetical protein [Candidatus Ethanoperedens thermophilum]